MTVSKALLHNDGRKSEEAQATKVKTTEAATSGNEKRGETCRELTTEHAGTGAWKRREGGGGAGSRAAAHGPYAGSGSSAPPPGLRSKSHSRVSGAGQPRGALSPLPNASASHHVASVTPS